MSTACAPSRSAWMPIRFRSRQVKCMLMSSPVASRTRIAVGRTDIRTRPSEPSLMSTISTPRSFRSFAPCTSFSILWPRGGSSSTVTRNSPASSRRCTAVGGGAGGERRSARRLHPGPAHRHDARRAAAGARAGRAPPAWRGRAGRRAAAAADHARSGRDHPRRVVRHVAGEERYIRRSPIRLGRPALGWMTTWRPPGLRHHLLEDVVEHARADRAVRAHRLDRQLAQRADDLGGGAAGEGHALVGERHLGEDRQVGEGADRLHRQPHLGEVREGLDHERVDAALQQPLRLLVERGARVLRLDAADRGQVLAERADRAQHQHVAAHALAHVARQLGPAQVDLAHAALQPVDAELEAVGPEGIRLDGVAARRDVFRVHRSGRASPR